MAQERARKREKKKTLRDVGREEITAAERKRMKRPAARAGAVCLSSVSLRSKSKKKKWAFWSPSQRFSYAGNRYKRFVFLPRASTYSEIYNIYIYTYSPRSWGAQRIIASLRAPSSRFLNILLTVLRGGRFVNTKSTKQDNEVDVVWRRPPNRVDICGVFSGQTRSEKERARWKTRENERCECCIRRAVVEERC